MFSSAFLSMIIVVSILSIASIRSMVNLLSSSLFLMIVCYFSLINSSSIEILTVNKA